VLPVRPTPAFIPPVIALPAASAAVPAIAGAVATGVSLPVLPLVGAVVVGGVVAGLAALAIGAAVNGQLWGYLNSRGGVGEPGNWVGPIDVPMTGATVVVGGRNGAGTMQVIPGPEVEGLYPYGPPIPDNATVSAAFVHVPNLGGFYHGWIYEMHWTVDGVAQSGCIKGGSLGNCIHDQRTVEEGPSWTVLGWEYTPDKVPVPEVVPVYPSPAAPPQIEPEPLAEPEPEPARVVPLPFAPPAAPEAEPVEQPRPPVGLADEGMVSGRA